MLRSENTEQRHMEVKRSTRTVPGCLLTLRLTTAPIELWADYRSQRCRMLVPRGPSDPARCRGYPKADSLPAARTRARLQPTLLAAGPGRGQWRSPVPEEP